MDDTWEFCVAGRCSIPQSVGWMMFPGHRLCYQRIVDFQQTLPLYQIFFLFPGSSDPQPCTPGQFCQFDGLSAPSGPCTAGYYCSGRASSPTPSGDDTGNICPAGYYCEEGASVPVSCAPGTYSPSTGNKNVTDCLSCTPGEWCGDYNLTTTSGKFDFYIIMSYNFSFFTYIFGSFGRLDHQLYR